MTPTAAPGAAAAWDPAQASDAALVHAAAAMSASGESAGALRLVSAVAARSPENAPALRSLSALYAATDPVAAEAAAEQAVCLDPLDADAWFLWARSLARRKRLEEAARAYRRCLDIDPAHHGALPAACECIRVLGGFGEALSLAERMLLLGREDWMVQHNIAVCLLHMARFPEARGAFDRSLALSGGAAITRWERFALDLFERRFAAAWAGFETRFAIGELTGVFAYPFPQPLWRGEPLGGKHLLIHNEQGLGDQLMFASALADLPKDIGRLSIVIAPELLDIFRASFPQAEVHPARYGAFAGDHPEPSWLPTLPPVDFQIPIGSLMPILRATDESFADPVAYLRPTEEARSRWAALGMAQGLNVGICWASNPALFRDDSARRARRKSMTIDRLAPLAAIEGVHLHTVLNWSVDPMPEAFRGRLVDHARALTSMNETAALIERLDVVVTVDTAVAHLAGALGKPTIVMLHEFADARWELHSASSYWYPDVRLVRQKTAGAWDGVVGEVADLLRRWAPAAIAPAGLSSARRRS